MITQEKHMVEDVLLVKRIGDRMGYGHLMSLASALWRNNLPNGQKMGAFVCVCDVSVKEEILDAVRATNEVYDEIVKKALEGGSLL